MENQWNLCRSEFSHAKRNSKIVWHSSKIQLFLLRVLKICPTTRPIQLFDGQLNATLTQNIQYVVYFREFNWENVHNPLSMLVIADDDTVRYLSI